MNTYYFVQLDSGDIAGPYNTQQMRELWRTARIHCATQVQDSGSDSWDRAGTRFQSSSTFAELIGFFTVAAALALAVLGGLSGISMFTRTESAIVQVTGSVIMVGAFLAIIIAGLGASMLMRK